MTRWFLLSPASASGKRAGMLVRPGATFPLARAIQSTEGAPIGKAFEFMSGLYFRGKLAYANAFGVGRTLVITPNRGLARPEERINAGTIEAFAKIDIAVDDDRFKIPFHRDAAALDEETAGQIEVVLLGSIASSKYVDTLVALFGERLLFPREFIGRGDMSRGGLLLRAVREGRELEYAPVLGTERKGTRPPKLEPIKRPTR